MCVHAIGLSFLYAHRTGGVPGPDAVGTTQRRRATPHLAPTTHPAPGTRHALSTRTTHPHPGTKHEARSTKHNFLAGV